MASMRRAIWDTVNILKKTSAITASTRKKTWDADSTRKTTEEDMGYGQYPENDFGDYSQYPEEGLDYYGQYTEEDMGYGHYDGESLADFGHYPEESVQGYVPEVEPPFNPRGDFGTQLSGYEREKSVNPTCVYQKPADIAPIMGIPAFFKPYF
jgi:hypothetical protein